MVLGGIWSTLVNLGLFAWALNSGRSLAEAMTMTFVSLVLIQFFKAYNFRSDRHSVFNKPFANKWLNLAVGWELVLLVLIVYLPFLHEAVQHLRPAAGGLADHRRPGRHHRAGAGAGQVDGAAGYLRQGGVIV